MVNIFCQYITPANLLKIVRGLFITSFPSQFNQQRVRAPVDRVSRTITGK